MNSIFDNNNVPFGAYGGGMAYGQPKKECAWTNALGRDEEKALHEDANSVLSLNISKEEMWRAKCTHRDPGTKTFTVTPNPDGSYTCTKCGATFNIVTETDIENIKRVIGGTIDILQTAKMAYLNLPAEVIQSYFVILPFLQLAPKFYEMGISVMNKELPNSRITPNHTSADIMNSYFSMMSPGSVGPVAPVVDPQQYAQYLQYMQQMAAMNGVVNGAMNPPTGPVAVENNPMQSKPAMPAVTTATESKPVGSESIVNISKQWALD